MARNYKVKMELEVDSKSMNKLKQLFKDMDMKWNRDTLKEAKTMSDQMRELNKTLAKLRVDLSKIKSFGGSSKGDEKNLEDLLKEVKTLNDNTMKNHNQIITKYFKIWTDAKGGMKQGKDLSEEGKTTRQYSRERIAQIDADSQYQKTLWHTQVQQEHAKLIRLDDQLKNQRMLNRSFLSTLGSGGSFFQGIKQVLKTTDTFSKYDDMLKLMHIDPSIKAKIEQARMSHDPVAQATASSLAANEGVNLSNAMAAQNTILGKILKKIDRITPDASTPRGMAMAGLGIAGVALLTKAFRKALDSSPMLKQMAKLLDFGVMLVLRPIGDFFGFLFRPILILLLRKFIIPFYQEYMPLMRKLGGDIGNFLTKVIDIATSFEGMTAAGAAVAAGIFAYFKKKGGKIQIFSKNAVANLAKMARPSLWSRISNALTMKAPKASYWRRVSNALRIKGSIPKLPKLQLQIPKSLQPLIKIIQETQDALSKTKIPPTSDDVVKTPLKELDRPPRGSKFTVPVSALSKAATILNLWDLASGKMGYDIFNAANAPEMTEFNKQMHGQASEIYPWMSGTKDPLVDRWGDIGGIPSTGQILSGDWGMGTPPPSSTPNHQIIIQADTITTEAIDNVTDKMVNGKRTFSSLG